MNYAGLLFLSLAICIQPSCKKNSGGTTTPVTPAPTAELKTTVDITRAEKFQHIDGFGFFGAQDVWWGAANNMYSDAWATAALTDLGITIWRDELHPPATPTVPQDADWNKRKPVVEGLVKLAAQHKVPLKFIFSVWSPPASMKVAIDANGEPISGTPNSGGTKGTGNAAGTLDPAKYIDFGNYLADGIQLYKDAGATIYAISPQNEPLFKQPFNSNYYKPARYSEMLQNAMPVVKARFPAVKIFGSENMLEIEAEKDRQWFYGADLMKRSEALSNLDIWAYHGYLEGISPTASSKLATLWNVIQTEYTQPSGKPVWMTETSGYGENWVKAGNKPGALDLAIDIQSALIYGNVSAWVWWQGSELAGIGEYNLMQGTTRGKKYYASKQFYRFIRPGARRVKLNFNASDGVIGSAFEHTALNNFVVVLINSSEKAVQANLTGANIPADFDYYLSTSADNCKKRDTKVKKEEVILPARSIVTLVNGRFEE
jgi:O-glycosyl hydrolase